MFPNSTFIQYARPTLWIPDSSANSGYRTLDIGALSTIKSYRTDFPVLINNRLQATGTSINKSAYYRAFLWQNDSMRDLGAPSGALYSVGLAISPEGRIAGQANDGRGVETGFLWSKNKFTALTNTGRYFLVMPSSIFDRTESVAGVAYDSYYQPHPFLWYKGEFIEIDDLLISSSAPGLFQDQPKVQTTGRPFFLHTGQISVMATDQERGGFIIGRTSSVNSIEPTKPQPSPSGYPSGSPTSSPSGYPVVDR